MVRAAAWVFAALSVVAGSSGGMGGMGDVARLTVLVEVEEDAGDAPRRARCVASVPGAASEGEKESAMIAAALEEARVDASTHECSVLWRRSDVATVTIAKAATIAKALPGRAFAHVRSLAIGGRSLPLVAAKVEGLDGEHAAATAVTTWDGSVALAMFLERAGVVAGGARVVELGSGTAALPGLAAALLGAARVTLTDQGAALDALAARVGDALPADVAGAVAVAEVDWLRGVPDAVGAEGVDLVLASDTVWLEALVVPFADCVETLLRKRPGRPTLYLAHQTRSTRVDDLLFAALRGRGLAVAPETDLHPDFAPAHVAIFKVT